MTKSIHINAFSQCSICPQSKGQWKNPRDRSSHGYKDVEFWLEMARTLERGCVDALFFADIHGVYDVYGGGMDAGIRHAVQFPGNDPSTLVALLAHETANLGFIFTCSTTYYPPFHTAKLFSSLDHFTDGRVGWNIVTSYLDSAYKNGLGDKPLPHDERYDQADEYMEVVYKLWEQSWDEDAIVRDMVADVHTDPARVHTIDHSGKYYSVRGPHMCEPSPQRTPLLVQAGQSPRGLRFGTTHAEALFVAYQGVDDAKAQTPIIRDLAEAAGRSRNSVKLLMAVSCIVGETEREAKLKYEQYMSLASPEGALALFGGWTGIDLAGYEMSAAIRDFESEQIKSVADFFCKPGAEREFTLRDMVEYMSLSSIAPVFVGDATQVADQLEELVDVGGIDGFNFVPVVQPDSARDLVDLLIPELQRRGRFRTKYEGTTLRERFLGAGHSRLESTHPAAALTASKQ